MDDKYIHDEQLHNLESPRVIAPLVLKFVTAKSVVDIGCGLGTFLVAFKELGVEQVLGVDGKWANRKLVRKYLKDDEFMIADLEQPIPVQNRFDLAICLEVAEHISEASSDQLVQSLTKLSDRILFSAAIPYQEGQHHLNEQWPAYWKEKFKAHGYIFWDIIRPKIWNDAKVHPWYKQNMFYVSKESMPPPAEALEYDFNACYSFVTKHYYLRKSRKLLDFIYGHQSVSVYFMYLMKSILRKTGLYKKTYKRYES